MKFSHSLFRKIKSFFHFLMIDYRHLFKKENRRYLYGIGLSILFIIFIIKGCSLSDTGEAEYAIGQDTRLSKQNLLGKELNLIAFNNDLLTQIGKEEHIRFHIYPTHENDLITDLEMGKLQGALTFLPPSRSDEKRFIFSEPIFLNGPVLVISQETTLSDWRAASNKIIGVNAQTPALQDLERTGLQFRFYDEILKAFNDVKEQKIDGAIFPVLLSYTYIHTFYPQDLKIITPPLTNSGLRLVAKRDDDGEELIKQ
ncbi:MAG: transporter substrate-binding domain-containing protein, partial [Parachlamydiaceae bacterium]|nr:transporter substrate-binding domain-containing protein [Parachlamydiaceae bacterium]